jgi:hypothetical protein
VSNSSSPLLCTQLLEDRSTVLFGPDNIGRLQNTSACCFHQPSSCCFITETCPKGRDMQGVPLAFQTPTLLPTSLVGMGTQWHLWQEGHCSLEQLSPIAEGAQVLRPVARHSQHNLLPALATLPEGSRAVSSYMCVGVDTETHAVTHPTLGKGHSKPPVGRNRLLYLQMGT